MKNRVLLTVAKVVFMVMLAAAAALDSQSVVPLIIFLASAACLAVFVTVNRDKLDAKIERWMQK